MLMLLAGCASAIPTPVTDIGPFVGNWSGIVDLGGPLLPFYLTIYENQSLVATWGLKWTWGTIAIANGQATYQMSPPPTEGTFRLYLDEAKPTLYMDDLWLSFHAVVTKLPAPASTPVDYMQQPPQQQPPQQQFPPQQAPPSQVPPK
ncbi:MAG TPA: hypothetical protein VMS64_12080 [Candidatus Methylomirabilis sp.]|nr:hypothetical protein [Candidatus Methylomirabilis sp.]